MDSYQNAMPRSSCAGFFHLRHTLVVVFRDVDFGEVWYAFVLYRGKYLTKLSLDSTLTRKMLCNATATRVTELTWGAQMGSLGMTMQLWYSIIY